jgi:hypothetical protein
MLQLLAHIFTPFSAVNFPQNKFLRRVKIYFQDFEDLLNHRVNTKQKIAAQCILQPTSDKTGYL